MTTTEPKNSVRRLRARHRAAGIKRALAIILGFGPAVSAAHAYEITQTISPDNTRNPIEIIFWVAPDVSEADERRTVDGVMAGVKLWEDVPTACISFVKKDVIRAATRPLTRRDQLLIPVGQANAGGAGFPSDGLPGQWSGIRADLAEDRIPGVAAHEVGHAIGFDHSGLSEHFATQYHGIMNWRASGPQVLNQDDIAAVSVAYPCAETPLSLTTATVRGRMVTPAGAPVIGVNAVVVEEETGRPVVARFSGHRGQPGPGGFELAGIPPGRYRVHFLDGASYGGTRTKLVPTGSAWQGGYQGDNFTPFASAPFSVSAGQVFSLGDVPIVLWDISLDGFAPGDLLPTANAGAPYRQSLRIRGGQRDLMGAAGSDGGVATGLPPGLTAQLSAPPPDNLGVRGRALLEISGTPTMPGRYPIDFVLRHVASAPVTFTHELVVRDCNKPLDASMVTPASQLLSGQNATYTVNVANQDEPGCPARTAEVVITERDGSGNAVQSKTQGIGLPPATASAAVLSLQHAQGGYHSVEILVRTGTTVVRNEAYPVHVRVPSDVQILAASDSGEVGVPLPAIIEVRAQDASGSLEVQVWLSPATNPQVTTYRFSPAAGQTISVPHSILSSKALPFGAINVLVREDGIVTRQTSKPIRISQAVVLDDFSTGIGAWTFHNGRPGDRGNYWDASDGKAVYRFFFEPGEGSYQGSQTFTRVVDVPPLAFGKMSLRWDWGYGYYANGFQAGGALRATVTPQGDCPASTTIEAEPLALASSLVVSREAKAIDVSAYAGCQVQLTFTASHNGRPVATQSSDLPEFSGFFDLDRVRFLVVR